MILTFMQGFVLAVMWCFIGWRIAVRALRHDDGILATIIAFGILTRLLVAVLNEYYGPLPGAQVDAVYYDAAARSIAGEFAATGHFTIYTGRFGYSSMLAALYIVGGDGFLLPATLNLVFVTEFLLLVHWLGVTLGSKDAGRAGVLFAALYPTSILYTAVPLREAWLLWAFALFVTGLVRYYEDMGHLLGPRTVLGFAALILVHDGFAPVLFLIAAAAWLKHDETPIWKRGLVLAAAALLMGVVFWNLSGMFRKLPDDPRLLLDPAFLAEIRAWKTSYGVGYGAVEPTWTGIAKAIPLLVFAFLAAPFPAWIRSAADIPKAVEGLVALGVSVAGVLAVLSARDVEFRRRTKLLLVVFGFIVLLFAVGTGNTGLAARHRAKFIWIPGLLVALRLFHAGKESDAETSPDVHSALTSHRNYDHSN